MTLPWGSSTAEPRTVRLYLYTANGTALTRPTFNKQVWKPAIRSTGIPDTRENGMHVLRHTYASVLLDLPHVWVMFRIAYTLTPSLVGRRLDCCASP